MSTAFLMPYAEEIRKLYVDEQLSLRQIAAKYQTNQNDIRRFLIHVGIKTRDQKAASKAAIDGGRATNPKGSVLSEEIKDKISETMVAYQEGKNERQRKAFSRKMKAVAENTPKEFIELRNKKACEELRRTCIHGSKFEIFVAQLLMESGFNVIRHAKVIENSKLEVDISLPDYKLAIEIDGPSHIAPVWSEETLAKTQRSDQQKNGLLLQHGWKVARIICKKFKPGRHRLKLIREEVLSIVNDIIASEEMFHYVEIKKTAPAPIQPKKE